MDNFITLALKRFKEYKALGDKTIDRLSEGELNYVPAPGSNSITVVIKHLHGNMLSRWTDLLTTDGEKSWRQRDAEFEEANTSKEKLWELWEAGWTRLFDALKALNASDLEKTITIRSQPLSVMDAILRQVAHYSYHVGQIVYLGKMQLGEGFESLSIPKKK